MTALIMLIALNTLTFWQRNTRVTSILLFILAGVTDIVYGLNYAAAQTVNSTAWVMGISITILGVMCIYLAVAKVIGIEKGRES
jgi:hypothetical protein